MPQIRFSRNGKRFSISERFWEQIKSRLDVRNAKKREHQWQTEIPCPLCKRHPKCVGCTFAKYSSGSGLGSGCVNMIDDFLTALGLGTKEFWMWEDSVWWTTTMNKRAREQLKALHQKLSEIG